MFVWTRKNLIQQHQHQQQPFDFSDGSRNAPQFLLRDAQNVGGL
jgi:hypothetical protein